MSSDESDEEGPPRSLKAQLADAEARLRRCDLKVTQTGGYGCGSTEARAAQQTRYHNKRATKLLGARLDLRDAEARIVTAEMRIATARAALAEHADEMFEIAWRSWDRAGATTDRAFGTLVRLWPGDPKKLLRLVALEPSGTGLELGKLSPRSRRRLDMIIAGSSAEDVLEVLVADGPLDPAPFVYVLAMIPREDRAMWLEAVYESLDGGDLTGEGGGAIHMLYFCAWCLGYGGARLFVDSVGCEANTDSGWELAILGEYGDYLPPDYAARVCRVH